MAHKKAAASAKRRAKAAKPANRTETGKRKLPDAARPFMFKPGQSGNPSGRPKRDFAAEIAQAIFEKNPDLVYKAMLKSLKRGSPQTFEKLAERGYGKAPQHVEIGGTDGGSIKVEFVNVAACQEP